MTAELVPFVIPDCRRPGVAMAAVAIKLPPESTAQLGDWAARLGTTRTALGRALVMRGLDQLEQNDAQGVA